MASIRLPASGSVDTGGSIRLLAVETTIEDFAMLGLTERDFDAYLPDRASSNAYSRPRLEFKQRAILWARGVTERLQSLGISVDVHASDEHPSVWNSHRVDCQWVFFWRDAATRADLDALLDQKRQLAHRVNDPSPYFRHAFMALRLDAAGVEVCVQLHPDAWVDFETLRDRLRDPERDSQLSLAIHDLPEQFRFGPQSGEHSACSQVTGEALLDVVNDCASTSRTLWIGWRVDRSLAIEHAEILDEQLEDALVALAPAYLQVSWGRDDDPAGILQRIEFMKAEQLRLLADRKAVEDLAKAQTEQRRREATEKSRERTRERVDYETPRSRPTLANLFKSDVPAEKTPVSPAVLPQRPDRQDRPEKPARTRGEGRNGGHAHAQALAKTSQHEERRRRDSVPASQTEDRVQEPRVESEGVTMPQQGEARERAVNYVESSDLIDKGVHVKVLRGAFAGKIGVIGELDGKGTARVLLGLLSTRVPTADLVAVSESKDRPALQSSHQRRSPIGRSTK